MDVPTLSRVECSRTVRCRQ